MWRYLITSQDEKQPAKSMTMGQIGYALKITENSTRFDNLARGFSVPIEVMQSLSIFHASSDGLRLGFYFPNTPHPVIVANEALQRSPPTNVIILMVTGILCGG